MDEPSSQVKPCLVCGDVAAGINFNVQTCYSCKSFFRRNAFRINELRCAYNNNLCVINQNNRRFCAKCRLQKCLALGMKKEWILTPMQKHLIKQRKITKTMLRHFHHQVAEIESEVLESYRVASLGVQIAGNGSNQSTEISSSSISTNNLPQTMIQQEGNSSCHESNQEPNNQLALIPINNLDQNSISNYLDSLHSNTQAVENFCSYDHSSEFYEVPEQRQISLPPVIEPTRELILPEKYLLVHLSSACTTLKNPYKRIVNFYELYRGQKSSATFNTDMIVRFGQMVQRLDAAKLLPVNDQENLVKCSQLDMMTTRSVLSYSPDRQAWGIIDDKFKAIVMVPIEVMRPFQTEAGFEQHKNLPSHFREEWKRDQIIFDLLTAIVLFTPRDGQYVDLDKIQEEYFRYTRLLRRYLEMKYRTKVEAEQCFHKLLSNIEQVRQINNDIMMCFQNYRKSIHKSMPK